MVRRPIFTAIVAAIAVAVALMLIATDSGPAASGSGAPESEASPTVAQPLPSSTATPTPTASRAVAAPSTSGPATPTPSVSASRAVAAPSSPATPSLSPTPSASRPVEVPAAPQEDLPVVVVTGSSTVALWEDSALAFPDAHVENTGVGKSTMESLVGNYEEQIGQFDPDQIFIGTGENDLAAGRTPGQVMAFTRALLAKVHADLPEADIVLMAAKPSVQRWHLRGMFKALNAGFAELAAKDPDVRYLDIWTPLVDSSGQVRPELYAADGLHLNQLGYAIYTRELSRAGASNH